LNRLSRTIFSFSSPSKVGVTSQPRSPVVILAEALERLRALKSTQAPIDQEAIDEVFEYLRCVFQDRINDNDGRVDVGIFHDRLKAMGVT
jgi:hypothetical protein